MQLVIIMTKRTEAVDRIIRERKFPRMYCLLPHKLSRIYKLPWRNISADFEGGLMSAISELFPHHKNPEAQQYNVELSSRFAYNSC